MIICKHMQMLCFKFHQNHTINEEFDFWWLRDFYRGFGGCKSWHNLRICPKHHRGQFLPKKTFARHLLEVTVVA